MITELPGRQIVEHFEGSRNQGNEHSYNMTWLTVLKVENRLKVGNPEAGETIRGYCNTGEEIQWLGPGWWHGKQSKFRYNLEALQSDPIEIN